MGEATEVERLMKASFGQDIGKQRMLRGEQLFRRHQVDVMGSNTFDPREGGYTLSAKIMSQHVADLAPGGAYTTTIEFTPMTPANLEQAYEDVQETEHNLLGLLARTAQHGKERDAPEFKVAVPILMRAAAAHLHSATIIPETWSQAAKIECNCLEFKGQPNAWCKHVGALAYLCGA